MKQNEAERLKKGILKSGIPLEIEVSSTLQKDGWLVTHQFPYFDENAKKVRSIDIFSFKLSPDQKRVIALMIECKKSTDHPWTFYTASKTSDFGAIMATMITHFQKMIDKEITINQANKIHLLNMTKGTKVGIIEYVPYGKKDDFFEALNQVLNALTYKKDQEKERKTKYGVRYPTIFYPVIVFDGDIYEFYLQKGELRIKPIEYLQFIAGGTAAKIDLNLVDVMKKNYFPEYLKLINKELESLAT